jgi:hypothetical protein
MYDMPRTARHAQNNKNLKKRRKIYVLICKTLNRKTATSNTTETKIAAPDGKAISAKSNVSSVC